MSTTERFKQASEYVIHTAIKFPHSFDRSNPHTTTSYKIWSTQVIHVLENNTQALSSKNDKTFPLQSGQKINKKPILEASPQHQNHKVANIVTFNKERLDSPAVANHNFRDVMKQFRDKKEKATVTKIKMVNKLNSNYLKVLSSSHMRGLWAFY